MTTGTIREVVEIDAPPEKVWNYLVDWPRQSEWIPATTVRGDPAANGVGNQIEAWTGIGPVGFLDTMTITAWDPPHRCEVLHTGRTIRGEGGFVVVARGESGSRCEWWERFSVPGGALSGSLWRVTRPFMRVGVRRALQALKQSAER